jgi:hypothetical protein
MTELKQWEQYGINVRRIRVDGGYIYKTYNDMKDITSCFVPDIDLTRYQAHLRDAYNKGFQDGLGEGKLAVLSEIEKKIE